MLVEPVVYTAIRPKNGASATRFGDIDVHANLGYTAVGSPAGSQLNDIYNFALAAEYKLGPKYDLFGEILATSSSGCGSDTAGGGGGLIMPEAPTGEFVGTLVLAKHVNENLLVYLGLGFDNNSAAQLRVGFTAGF